MGALRTRAAVLREAPGWWEITDLDLDEPKANEVRIRLAAAGLCHSDDHIRSGDSPARLPVVGGHEGAGVVEAVGPGVTRVAVGDHVVCSFIPVCGTCRYCSTGRQGLCELGANAATGQLPDGTFRFHENGTDIGGMCVLGTFSERTVVSEYSCVKVDDDIPLEIAALVSCGVPTGWGSSVYRAGVRPGDTVVIFGIGGVGINAVQGARYAGAQHVIAIDPLEFKLKAAEDFGATLTFSDPDAAKEKVIELTRGKMADHVICTVGVMNAEVVSRAVDLIGKGATVTITGIGKYHVDFAGAPFTGWQKHLQGTIFGGANPVYDIPRLLNLWRTGDLKLTELITRRYSLDQVNDGYRDLLDGKLIRGLIEFE